ncbi:hypothetical protein ACOMHN_058683 [Nucella lapillus]
MADFKIREAKEDDCEDIMQLVKKLGDHVKLLDPISVTAEDLRRDGFGQNPCFHVFVAEATTEGSEREDRRPLVGYTLYYYTYSPFVGRTCFMEDFFVREDWREKGIGSALLATLTQRALSTGCVYVNWIVFSWNGPSIDYYRHRGAEDMTEKEGWLSFKMGRDRMKQLVEKTLPHTAAKNTE